MQTLARFWRLETIASLQHETSDFETTVKVHETGITTETAQKEYNSSQPVTVWQLIPALQLQSQVGATKPQLLSRINKNSDTN
jgi:hypothetical protein